MPGRLSARPRSAVVPHQRFLDAFALGDLPRHIGQIGDEFQILFAVVGWLVAYAQDGHDSILAKDGTTSSRTTSAWLSGMPRWLGTAAKSLCMTGFEAHAVGPPRLLDVVVQPLALGLAEVTQN